MLVSQVGQVVGSILVVPEDLVTDVLVLKRSVHVSEDGDLGLLVSREFGVDVLLGTDKSTHEGADGKVLHIDLW